jgi:Raf kinase inhibitor-like YbhB/YbcL family protein
MWLLFALGCGPEATPVAEAPVAVATPAEAPPPVPVRAAPTLSLRSKAFGHTEPIPTKYTCEGNDVSPPLAWSDPPAGTKSFALVVDDPDVPDPSAPQRTWVHWVVYDLPGDVRALPEAVGELPEGARDGTNDWKRTGYGGPCPPSGRHRYKHKLYALDTVLGDRGPMTKGQLIAAIGPHVLAKTELLGTYVKAD